MWLRFYLIWVWYVNWCAPADAPIPEISMQWPYQERLEWIYDIQFFCDLPPNVHCAPESVVEIYDADTSSVLEKEECGHFVGYPTDETRTRTAITIYFDANKTVEEYFFHKLHCRYRNEYGAAVLSANSVTVPFLLSKDDSKECSNSDCDSEDGAKFCVKTKNGVHPCSNIDSKWCSLEKTNNHFCPVNEIGICRATAKNYDAIWYTTFENGCLNVQENPLSYKGRNLLYMEPFLADKSEPFLRFKCPKESPFFNITIEYAIQSLGIGTMSTHSNQTKCVDEALLLLPEKLFDEGPTVYEIKVNSWVPNRGTSLVWARFSNRLITFAGIQINANADNNILRCNISQDVDWFFDFKVWWTKQSSGDKRLQETSPSNLLSNQDPIKLNLTDYGENDSYQCHASLVFKTCTPHRTFERIISSEKISFASNSATAFRSGLALLTLFPVLIWSLL